MKVAVYYTGSSLLAPLKNAEQELNREYNLDLIIAPYNFGSPLTNEQWDTVEQDLRTADVVFAIHVMDGDNAARLLLSLEQNKSRHRAVIVINCMPALMRCTRMGRLDVSKVVGSSTTRHEKVKAEHATRSSRTMRLFGTAGSWLGRQVSAGRSNNKSQRGSHTQYLKLIDKLPGILRLIPSAGGLRDVKNYLNLFCYFLQPTPANIRSMILCSLKEYVPDKRLKSVKLHTPPVEHMPSVAVYHPDAAEMFESFGEYKKWCAGRSATARGISLDRENTVGLLLMRPQVVSGTTKHYDALIRAVEAEGLSVIPALSTLMDNREAVSKFFVENDDNEDQRHASKVENRRHTSTRPMTEEATKNSRVSQIVSLTGFSFVGGPAMNDSEAAAEFLQQLNRPYRSAVSLDTQTIDAWRSSQIGLNPVQAGMQIAIPEIDGATEPFIYGGIPANGVEPVALEDRCRMFARRLRRWNRLRTCARSELKLALVLFCFPPNKGNIGTAADLDVFPGLLETLKRLQDEGYTVELPDSADALRSLIIDGRGDRFASMANVAYRMNVSEYRRLCPYTLEIEREWGPAPGSVNSFGGDLLIQGIHLGNVFVGVQPTFGYEGDPMRLMMARSGAPHHGFMAFYTYLSQVLNVDAAIHVGTHGSLEFMPGKQVGMSGECWPDRLIGELPNLYLYSVNNPSEGSIAKRRSYAELISYLTPPIENAGLYKDLNTMKDLVMSYRQSADENERERLFEGIEEYAATLNFLPQPTRARSANSEAS